MSSGPLGGHHEKGSTVDVTEAEAKHFALVYSNFLERDESSKDSSKKGSKK